MKNKYKKNVDRILCHQDQSYVYEIGEDRAN